ncbi:MAG: hypothetical protein IJX69_04055 [Oscillospiraceae bacterium]|nr:hypothetical protein [Oscillospiraceae bacterium]
MQRMKRYPVVILLAMLMLMLLPIGVSANGPAPVPWLDVYLTNAPEGTAYVDLLIPLTEDDPRYSELNEQNLPEGFSAQSPIVTYCEDGFRSYTFHFEDALSSIAMDGAECFRYEHLDDIEQQNVIRLAMLDEKGNILKVSDDLSMGRRRVAAFIDGPGRYDAATGEWELEMSVSGSGIVFYVILSGLGVGFTCFLERLMAWVFGVGKPYGRLVLKTNLFSQLIMRVAFILLYGVVFWRYSHAVIFLEVLVYLSEYLVYHVKMKSVSWKRKLLYTVAANTVSLVLCYRLNQLLLYNQ